MIYDLILFPSEYYDIKKIDSDLRQEYDAVKETGLFDIVLFGYDQWFSDGKLKLQCVPETMRGAVYRGWMMKPEDYERFYLELLKNNIKLVTSPDQYRLMHIFPNVYKYVRDDTAKMEIFPLHEKIDVEKLKKSFNRFMVKDFVKSEKGTEIPRFFDDKITQEEFDHWMEVFYNYRGSLLTGGICIKEYLSLKVYGDKTNEFRVFYINNTVATICRNSGQGNYTPEPPRTLIDKYRDLDGLYYTVDYAELDDGRWVVIEAGDGEVSGLSEGQDYCHYFRSLYHLIN